MATRKAALETERAQKFTLWKATLERHDGNVTRAARELYPELNTRKACDRGGSMVRKLGLAKYAADLREKATGRRGAGRPRDGGK